MPSRAGGAALAEGSVVGEADGVEGADGAGGVDGVDMTVSRSGRPRARGCPGRGELPTEHYAVNGDCLRLVLDKIRRGSPVCKE
ncbi:hypothetical protein GCM10010345_15130 [Streptomyces canarius]|uniref:Transposase n=1 Tax=Streptomyces canarius TaxID=285453 RepID=A0ABQ3CHB5_9ACTN|nr:hypothetical protein GCM10010345_15130 [Streptomyces canarius]